MATNSLNIITFNVRGLNNYKKRLAIFKYLQNNQCDIAFLQETYSSSEIENKWKSEWGGQCVYHHGTKHSKGLLIMFRKALDVEIVDEVKDKYCRYLYLKTRINDNITHLVNVYAPNKENEQVAFANSLTKLLSQKIDESLEQYVLGGDWNIPLNIELDKKGGTMHIIKKRYIEKLKEIMNTHELLDIWRYKNKNKKQFTWRQNNPKIHSRLDYFLITQNNLDTINSCKILPSILSDHSPVHLQIRYLHEPNRGPGYWKLNSSLLKDETYKSKVKELLETLNETHKEMENKALKWELYKYEIRKFSMKHSKQVKKEKTDIKKTIEKNLEELLDKESENTNDIKQQITSLKDKLEEIYLEEAEGIKVRSRVQWAEEGERNTAYFYNLEKENYKKKNIKRLVINNVEITDQNLILKHAANFYEDLYTMKSNCIDDKEGFLTNSNLPKLTEEEKLKCEGSIGIKECEEILKTFAKDRSPGNDGLPIEFYTEFWQEIKYTLIETFNYSYQIGNLTTSQKQAVITLINKPDKEREFIENWRPISLVNVDYKILTKCLAQRTKSIIQKLIHHSQFGFIKGRTINDAIRTILDIVDYTQIHDKQGILLGIDFQKAFDTLSWDFLFTALEKYNFGETFINWIKVCYTDTSSCVMNYGFSSNYFQIGRGVRAGRSTLSISVHSSFRNSKCEYKK